MHQLLRSKRLALGVIAVGTTLGLAVPGAQAVGSASPAPAIKITQSASDSVTPLNSVACGNSTNSSENHYYRRFDLSGSHNSATGFKVSEVSFAVEAASSGDNNVPGVVSVWAIDHTDPLTVADLEAVASTPVNLDSVADGALLTAPISATVPEGKDMVLEVSLAAQTTGKLFFIGSNAAAETAPSFIMAPTCAINAPTATAGIGFPNMHIVLYANGKSNDCSTAETALDTATAAVAPATAAKTKAAGAVTTATAADTAAKAKVVKANKKLKKAKKSGAAAKIKKAKKAAKAAKKAAKAAAAALTAANTALTTATAALTAANAAVTAKTATATTECAQPTLPAPRPAPSAPALGGVHGLVTAGS